MIRLMQICFLTLISLCLTAGCASKPIVDVAEVDKDYYQADLADCEKLAEQVNTDENVAASAVAGAAIGALWGAVFAVMSGDLSPLAYSAAFGAVSGGTDGAVRSDQEKAIVTRNCLSQRGWVVLN